MDSLVLEHPLFLDDEGKDAASGDVAYRREWEAAWSGPRMLWTCVLVGSCLLCRAMHSGVRFGCRVQHRSLGSPICGTRVTAASVRMLVVPAELLCRCDGSHQGIACCQSPSRCTTMTTPTNGDSRGGLDVVVTSDVHLYPAIEQASQLNCAVDSGTLGN